VSSVCPINNSFPMVTISTEFFFLNSGSPSLFLDQTVEILSLVSAMRDF